MTGLCISLFVVVVAVKGTCFFFCFDYQCKTPHCMSASRPVMCKIHSFVRSLTKIHPSVPPPPPSLLKQTFLKVYPCVMSQRTTGAGSVFCGRDDFVALQTCATSNKIKKRCGFLATVK